MGIGVYETINQPERETSKYEQEGRFCLGVAKVEIKYGTRTGKCCPVFDYMTYNGRSIDRKSVVYPLEVG